MRLSRSAREIRAAASVAALPMKMSAAPRIFAPTATP
jgi:hypothetical protein